MANPLMPMATAVWLVENTALTFQQIADFCGLHPLEVQAIADGEVAAGIVGLDPVANGQLDAVELKRCEADPGARLQLKAQPVDLAARGRRGRYTPVTKRQDKPDAIAFVLKRYPSLTDSQISRLLGTTKSTIAAVRDGAHKDSQRITPRDPIALGLCTAEEIQAALNRSKPKTEAAPAAKHEPAAEEESEEPTPVDAAPSEPA